MVCICNKKQKKKRKMYRTYQSRRSSYKYPEYTFARRTISNEAEYRFFRRRAKASVDRAKGTILRRVPLLLQSYDLEKFSVLLFLAARQMDEPANQPAPVLQIDHRSSVNRREWRDDSPIASRVSRVFADWSQSDGSSFLCMYVHAVRLHARIKAFVERVYLVRARPLRKDYV